MGSCVPLRGVIATADVTTLEADPRVESTRPQGPAILAADHVLRAILISARCLHRTIQQHSASNPEFSHRANARPLRPLRAAGRELPPAGSARLAS
jgi:hypothetical protein